MAKRGARVTRKNNKSQSGHDCGCEVTMHGIHKWYEAEFEKLGWMILAKHKGFYDKIATYKNSLTRLRDDIIHKIGHVHEVDRKTDLKIMLHNVEILMEHVKADF
jgi:hypothetical protein